MSKETDENPDAHRDAYRAPAHDSEIASESDEHLRRRGKLWVLAMIAAFALALGLRMLAAVRAEPRFALTFRIAEGLRQSSAAVVLLLLLFLVYRGKNWARWLVVAWLVLAAIGVAWLERHHFRFELENLFRKGVVLWTLGMLLFSPSIRALVTPPPRRFLD